MQYGTMALGAIALLAATMPLEAQNGPPVPNEQPAEQVVLLIAPDTAGATTARAPRMSTQGRYWRSFVLGFATSILVHEAGHVVASVALGGRPTVGFDNARPTIYSGLNANLSPGRQYVFSSAGLTFQALLDELILDIPHDRGSAFERGILAGGIGTTVFYLTVGRSGSVSDVEFMSRTSGLSKAEISMIYGGIAAIHAIRVKYDGRYANFFARPSADGRLRLGVDIR